MSGRLGRVGPYTLLERLGRGGMGEVYLAANRRGEHVAVKMLREPIEADSDARLRLDREIRALRRVESPYVAEVIDADLSGDRPYLVMEYIEGETLLEAVQRGGAMEESDLIPLAQGLATALAIIHAGGVVHRDVKPANVLVREDEPILIDFGIAQMLDATRLTLTGTFLGTPGYAAPELFADEVVGEPADVHAWAATVAFAATGRHTFGRGTVQSQMYAVLNGKADLAGVPASLLPLVRAALHRDPARRPTAALLSDRLARLARVSGDTPRGTATQRRTRPDKAGTEADVPEGEDQEADGTGGGRRVRPKKGGTTKAKAAKTRGANGAAVNGGSPGGSAGGAGGGSPSGSAGGSSGAGSVNGGSASGGSKNGKGARAGSGASAARRPRAGDRAESALAVEAPVAGTGAGIPTGGTVLLALGLLGVPCVVVSVVEPLATFAISGAFAVVTRAAWVTHWIVRNRRSHRTRGLLGVLSYPVTLVGSLVSGVVWPGAPAAAAAFLALWLTAGTHLEAEWWTQVAPVTVAGAVFGVVVGGIIGREIERMGARMPELRREPLRALAVFGGFVALCAGAVQAVSLFF
ncbi:serine/threonine-protein kinase [Planotetraspora silvatica]|nr:serine/threonine-protein kinase [Planotetraspora silvatica]